MPNICLLSSGPVLLRSSCQKRSDVGVGFGLPLELEKFEAKFLDARRFLSPPEGTLLGPHPQYGWDFLEGIPENSGKTPREYGWDPPSPIIQGI